MPLNIKLKILKLNKKKKIIYYYYLYTNNLKFIFNLKNKLLTYNTKIHSFLYYYKQNKQATYYVSQLKKIQMFWFFLICWKKFRITYTGKGYRIRKYSSINMLDFTFGACHFVKTFIPNYKLRFRRKKAILVFYRYPFWLKKNFLKITDIKLINLYTQRGLRNSLQITYRKPKTKAAYI